ncbi:MAG: cytochrome c biogenesis CcdA family protein [Chitinivibrionales bacterium]|nr:cytochrome c biogenesis CcdA family protein [Chitinivibrionales bacterium]
MVDNINIALVFVAGLASVLSPCVLPVVPIVITGGADEHKLRPLLVVAGISFAFVLMGVFSSLFGAVIGPKMHYIEKVAGILIALFGLLLIVNFNPFKYLGFFSRFAQNSHGRFGGLFLGFTLGIIWIPCVGPMLSSVLVLVASQGKILTGVFLLFIYSLGFAIPMLLAGYFSQFFRKRFRKIGKYPYLVNIISGALLLALGIFITIKGVIGFGF